jgi:hypothetical protein
VYLVLQQLDIFSAILHATSQKLPDAIQLNAYHETAAETCSGINKHNKTAYEYLLAISHQLMVPSSGGYSFLIYKLLQVV